MENTMQEITSDEIDFLIESNNIEDVWDDASLETAKKAWLYLKKQKKLTAANILKTHKILMEGKVKEKYLGHWRDCPVWIGGREAMPYYLIPTMMADWISLVMHLKHSLKDADIGTKVDHTIFERIHPFIDGNGRVGRMLMNWERLMLGLPILVIQYEDRLEYYRWFQMSDPE